MEAEKREKVAPLTAWKPEKEFSGKSSAPTPRGAKNGDFHHADIHVTRKDRLDGQGSSRRHGRLPGSDTENNESVCRSTRTCGRILPGGQAGDPGLRSRREADVTYGHRRQAGGDRSATYKKTGSATGRAILAAAVTAACLIGFFAAGKISNQHSGVEQLAARQPHKLEVGSSSLPPAITSTPAEERDGVWQVPAKAGLPGLSVTGSDFNATEVDQRAGDDGPCGGKSGGKSPPRSNYAVNTENSGKVSLHPAAGESSTSLGDLSSLATFFDAVRQVESAGQAAAVGDGGRSLGAYQIQRDYWADACEAGGVDWIWRETVLSAAHSEQVMRWYFQRYCPGPLQRITDGEPLAGDFEQLARTHNGGPAGPNKQSTLRYWRRIRAVMAQEANPKNG